ncbi:uncharacterized protein LOC135843991 [Planococcus citri]|uniref:uncharacterized protein LOC135843991 n=1 Tax=Planococcus citri TaxID=170843 RepID=UPI0031FA3846
MIDNHFLQENIPFESNQDRFVYIYNTPSLKEITSYRVSRAIWYAYISKYRAFKEQDTSKINCSPQHFGLDTFYKRKNKHDGFFRQALGLDPDYIRNIEKLVDDLETSARIKNVLKHFLKLVNQELKDWVEHFRDLLFPPGALFRREYRIHHIDPTWCVWLMNGEIDYQRTARNMLNDEDFTAAQKFFIMSEYCMEDEIKLFSLNLLPEGFIEQVNNNQDHILFYWICYLKNKQDKIPAENNLPSDLFIASNFQHFSRFSKEYFLSRLPNDDQVRIVIDWITRICLDSEHKRDCVILEKIISKMSLAQQTYLTSQISYTIAIYFSIYSNAWQCAFWAWRNSKDQMEVEPFSDFLGELLTETKTAPSACLLNKIWDTASSSQKNFAVNTHSEEFIDRLLLGDYHFPSVLEFFDRFLRLISTEERKNVIFERVDQFPYSNCDPDCWSFLVNLCLPCFEDQLKFKHSAIDSGYVRNSCEDLFRRRCFEKLNQKLEFYFSHDANAAQIFKRELLQDVSTNWKYIILSRDIFSCEWNQMCNFIDEAFKSDSSAGLKVKQQFLSTLAANIDLLDYFMVRDGFDNLQKIVEKVFSNDELNNVKGLFSNSFHRLLERTKGGVNEQMFNQKFMKWCSSNYDDDEVDTSDGNQQVSRDIVFDRIRTRSNDFFFSVKIFSEN